MLAKLSVVLLCCCAVLWTGRWRWRGGAVRSMCGGASCGDVMRLIRWPLAMTHVIKII